jgi:hypothetical protein
MVAKNSAPTSSLSENPDLLDMVTWAGTHGWSPPLFLGEHMSTVDSASDLRTVNNDVRHQYRILDDREKAAMREIKDKSQEFLDLLTSHFGRRPDGSYLSRELNLARTHIEEATMWAVKHLTA